MISRLVNLFKPAPKIAPLSDPAAIESQNRYWRMRILYSSMIGYALFYFVRKNLSLAMPAMEAELGISKADLGLFLTMHGLFYGVSKFTNGFLGDRANPRYFMPLGLALSAAANICFGFSSAVVTFGLFWLINGWFQGMGFPPCARSLTHWFSAKERGTKFAIWNTSHSIGAALVLLICSYLVGYNWRLCFFVPAGMALCGAVFLLNRLRDTPESLGLPPVSDNPTDAIVADEFEEQDEPPFRRFVIRHVFLNPMIWIISLANFFVYTVRFAILDWGPTFLHEMKGLEIQHAGWVIAAYEVTGIAGMLLSGWLTDKVKGKGARVCCVSMILCGTCIYFFWSLPSSSMLVNTALLCGMGFFIYGPQCLVGVVAANLASKRAAATAIGLTGLFGYLSGILSGWGLGMIVDSHGWNTAFLVLIVAAGVAAFLFALAYNAAYHNDTLGNSPKKA
ncbi:MAG: MFS transporter [Planctomycetota bacterium]|nr:MFS transporter [Planctomycetota bacterium]